MLKYHIKETATVKNCVWCNLCFNIWLRSEVGCVLIRYFPLMTEGLNIMVYQSAQGACITGEILSGTVQVHTPTVGSCLIIGLHPPVWLLDFIRLFDYWTSSACLIIGLHPPVWLLDFIRLFDYWTSSACLIIGLHPPVWLLDFIRLFDYWTSSACLIIGLHPPVTLDHCEWSLWTLTIY